DIAREIDLIEEIIRLYNYEKLEAKFETSISFGGSPLPERLRPLPLREDIRRWLVSNGFFEIITQNQIDPATAALHTEDPVRIANPLGEELSVMRPSAGPSALRVAEKNFRINNYNLRLFEIGRIFEKCDEREDTFIPGIRERHQLMIAITGQLSPMQWGAPEREVDFYDIRGVAEDLIEFLHLESLKLKAVDADDPLFSKNSLAIIKKKMPIGRLGQIRREILEKFDIKNNIYMILLDFEEFVSAPVKPNKYTPVSPFPPVTRDLAFVADKDAPAGDIENLIAQTGGKLLAGVRLFDVYTGKSVGDGRKSLAYALEFSSTERTLKDKEVDKIVKKIVKEVENKFNAKLREF
ncbi:MAG: hypothetical protein ACLFQX_07200, partial [Candidatus Kapaibacterium sp.]